MMFIIKLNGRPVLDMMTEKPKQFESKEAAQSYAELSRHRGATFEKLKS
jgi:hypothetical protein